jgi:hypothetical protein
MVNPHYKTPVNVLKAVKAYQVRNKDKIAEKDKVRHAKYYDENKKEILEKKRQYYQKKKAENQNDMNFVNVETKFPINSIMFV